MPQAPQRAPAWSWRGLSIGLKITAGVMLAMMLSFLIVAQIASHMHGARAQIAAAETGQALAELTATNAAGALKFRKADKLQEQFEQLLGSLNQQVLRVAAYDAGGALILALGDTDDTVLPAESAAIVEVVETAAFVWREDRFLAAAPAMFGPKNSIVGTVAITWNRDVILGQVYRTTMKIAAMGLGVAFVFALLLAIGMRFMVISPLRKLTSRIEQLAAGENVDIPFTSRSDEIGMLAESMGAVHQSARAGERLRVSLDEASSALAITDEKGVIRYANASFHSIASEIRPDLAGTDLVGFDLYSFDLDPTARAEVLAHLIEAESETVGLGGRSILRETNPITDRGGNRIGLVSEWWDRTETEQIEQDITRVAEAAAAGNFSHRVDAAGASDAHAVLAECVNRICEANGLFLEDVDRALSRLARGDLSRGIDGRYSGRFDKVATNLDAALNTLAPLIDHVKDASAEIGGMITDVRSSAGTMASRADEQATALRQTSVTMSQISAAVDQSANMARSAKDTANDASGRAERGGETVAHTVAAMREIEQRSTQITEITGVIETIAFQTNLLALNASVEAARAGDHGKGFAVVANEVRSLAHRASTAASDIKTLIEQTHGSVVEGGKLVDSTGATFSEIVEAVRSLAESVDSISEAGEDQKLAMSEMMKMISSLDAATQDNAHVASSSADNAEALAEVGTRLGQAVNCFTIPGRGEPDAEDAAA
ncbi:MAG: methyl-accepting chemotaxis protein [Pseudomonadota bacterium]